MLFRSDQNFTEVRFEAYRSLGEHVGSKLFMRSLIGSVADDEMVTLEAWFVALGRSLLPAVELSESARGNKAAGGS